MSNILTAVFADGETEVTVEGLWQWDYGQILKIEGLDLPDYYTVHFSNAPTRGKTKGQIGDADGVKIPSSLIETGAPVYAWIFLHTGDSDGETEYMITMPVTTRPKPDPEEPTEDEQSIIDQLIGLMQEATEQTAQDVETAAASVTEAANYANEASASADSAEQSATDAATAATNASTYASNASTSASDAAASATAAEAAATRAEEFSVRLSVLAETLNLSAGG